MHRKALTSLSAQVPVWLLKATRGFLKSFQWARDAADRLVSPPCLCSLPELLFVFFTLSICIPTFSCHLVSHSNLQDVTRVLKELFLNVRSLADILASNETFAAPIEDTYKLLDLDSFILYWQRYHVIVFASPQAFADILAFNETFAAPMEDTYKLLDLNPEDTTTLEQYLQVSKALWPAQAPKISCLAVACLHSMPHFDRLLDLNPQDTTTFQQRLRVNGAP